MLDTLSNSKKLKDNSKIFTTSFNEGMNLFFDWYVKYYK